MRLDSGQLQELASVFRAPRWLRDLGIASWLLVGAAALVVGLTVLAAATATIVDPVVAGLILATVTAPAVTWLKGHGVPRWGGALIVLLALVVLGLFIVFIVVGGITSQGDAISVVRELEAPTRSRAGSRTSVSAARARRARPTA